MKRLLHLLVAGGLGAALTLSPGTARAASSFVTVEQNLGGVTSVLRRVSAELGVPFSTGAASAVGGWRFVGWTVSSGSSGVLRDAWGRAFDGVSVKIYEETAFVAHYVPAALDTDGDGLADGDELYWYGSLTVGPTSDADGDGLTFAAELEGGTNPHFSDADSGEAGSRFASGVVSDGRDGIVYNPKGYPVCTFRSDPEGVLFETYSEVVAPGATLVSPACSTDGGFAYWQVGGDVQRDAFGRARDVLSLTQVSNDVAVVAVVETNVFRRASLYWYGRADVAADSDTDGDGFTFAEELDLGTNPLFADESGETDGVVSDGRDGVLYNPHGWRPYVVKADDGKLFAECTDYVVPGTRVTTPAMDASASDFAGWSVDGVTQRDLFGRARDTVTFEVSATGTVVVAHAEASAATRASLYWYGRADVALSSDTDGDGATLAEEIAAGTNPLFADFDQEGGVERDGREDVELNLQVYEQVMGFVVDGVVKEIGKAKSQGEGEGSGSQIWPVVADVNGDGLWDLIVVSEVETNVFVNTGTKGNPQFAKCGSDGAAGVSGLPSVGADVLGGPSVDLEMNSTAKLAEMTLDVAPVGTLSATTNGATLLVSDTEGRIWLYEGTEATEGTEGTSPASTEASTGEGDSSLSSLGSLKSLSYTLQHKVWGGSYAGFARGLRLAAVDWEDDGDLDCLCGTAEGKLMLLRDPKVGRPTGLTAAAGIDSVKLEWEPNGQSRVRGYRVYRSTGEGTEATEETEGTTPSSQSLSSLMSLASLVASVSLPRYRDECLAPATYAYKVSALSRFYTAGNSTPTETESVASEPVAATVGGVRFFWNDVVCKVGETASVMLSIENALNYNVAGRVQVVSYDPAYLEPVEPVPSGLAEKIKYTSSFADGQWTITLTEGVLPAGSGKFFTLIFRTLKSGETTVGEAKVSISSAPTYQLGDVNGDGKVDVLDLRLLAKLKSAAGRKYNSDQLRAGDFNGNGKLDNADYQALREMLKERGLL